MKKSLMRKLAVACLSAITLASGCGDSQQSPQDLSVIPDAVVAPDQGPDTGNSPDLPRVDLGPRDAASDARDLSADLPDQGSDAMDASPDWLDSTVAVPDLNPDVTPPLDLPPPDTVKPLDLSTAPDACLPKTCKSLGNACGSPSDGCGGTLNCGNCPSGQVCGWSGVPNVCSSSPPDPKKVAPPVDPSVATNIYERSKFLYTGKNPIQVGMAYGTVEPRRAAVIRGKVVDRKGNALAGVMVTVLGNSQYGKTATRADGWFDMAVNGGGVVKVDYEKAGYLPVQRHLQVPWGDYAVAAEAAMTKLDTKVTTITASYPNLQVARGTTTNDQRGKRTATLMFQAGTTAQMVLPGGTNKSLSSFKVRATEYTTGLDGLAAMPGPLPPNVAYTYAVELGLDEAIAAGATKVTFNKPVALYTENFISFPVGSPVPVGAYDRTTGIWVPEKNGLVVRVVGKTSAGLAEVDLEGKGAAASAAELTKQGFTTAELAELGKLYNAGASLWRVQLSHFTPIDCNWAAGLNMGANNPAMQVPEQLKNAAKPCTQSGSIIECQNQALGERIGLAGTPHNLNYRSDRVHDRKRGRSLEVALTGPSVSWGLKEVVLNVWVAGNPYKKVFKPTPNLKHTYVWDGKDAYGKYVIGTQPAHVRIVYVYGGFYMWVGGMGFGSVGTGGQIGLLNWAWLPEVKLWQDFRTTVERRDARMMGLEVWVLDKHHAYDPVARTLFPGWGGRRSVDDVNRVIDTYAGSGTGGYSGDGGQATKAKIRAVWGMTTDPAGNLYLSEINSNRVRKVTPKGVITTVAGNGYAGHSGDGGPATLAQLYNISDLAFDSAGNLFIGNGCRVRKVDAKGIITTVAGNGKCGFSGDGGPALNAGFAADGLAVDAHGNLYIADGWNHRVRKVAPNGIIGTVAGSGATGASGGGYSGDGGQATLAKLKFPADVEINAQGNLYIADRDNHVIRRVAANGVISTYAGTGVGGFSGDGGLATKAQLYRPVDMVLDNTGKLFIADYWNYRVRMVATNGVIKTVAGNGKKAHGGEYGSAVLASIGAPESLAINSRGDLFLYASTQPTGYRVRRVAAPMPDFSGNSILIPSEDGNLLYEFTPSGRHKSTVSTLTKAKVYDFKYNTEGMLSSVTDGDGNITTVQRNTLGIPTALVGPHNHSTGMLLNSGGYLTDLTNPASELYKFSYSSGGLLGSMTDPRGSLYTFMYLKNGDLTLDKDPEGGSSTLARTDSGNKYTVTLTTAEGRKTAYQTEAMTGGKAEMVNTMPDGTQHKAEMDGAGTTKVTRSDGIKVSSTLGPDPRWRMQAAIAKSTTLTTPKPKTIQVQRGGSATLNWPTDPMSLITLNRWVSVNTKQYKSTFQASTRQTTVTTPMGRKVEATVDKLHRPLSIKVKGQASWALTFNKGLLDKMVASDGSKSRTWDLDYDTNGFLSKVTDPLNRATSVTSRDAVGRIKTLVLPGNRMVTATYDKNGNLATLIPPGRTAHVFDYSKVDIGTGYMPPSVGAGLTKIVYGYNKDRQLETVTRPDGKKLAVSYTKGGKFDYLTLPGGSKLSATYDTTSGLLATLTSQDLIKMTLTRDGSYLMGVTMSGSSVKGSVTVTRNSDLQADSQSVNTGSLVNFAWDNDGLLTKAGGLVIKRNTDNGRIDSTTLGSVTTERAYNGFGEVGGLTAKYGSAKLFSTIYTRDGAGRITGVSETVGGKTTAYTYEHDNAGRLWKVRRGGKLVGEYTYDGNGNRATYTDEQNVTTTATTNNQDQLTGYNSASKTRSYAYTKTGELETRTEGSQVTKYVYDMLGNLTTVTLPSTNKITYLVDGLSRRVGKKVNGTLSRGWLYQDALNPVAELDGNNTLVSRFVYGSRANVPSYMVKGNGKTYRIIADHLGSVRLVVDSATGSVVQQMDYDAFGNVLKDTNPGFQPFGFAGGLYDPDTKLLRFGARDYDPEVGRWTARDPILFWAGDTNLYGYVINDPVNWVDPDGRAFWVPMLAGGIAGGLLGGLGTAVAGGSWGEIGQNAAAGFIGGAIAGFPLGKVSWFAKGGWESVGFIGDMFMGGLGGGLQSLLRDLGKGKSWCQILKRMRFGAFAGATLGAGLAKATKTAFGSWKGQETAFANVGYGVGAGAGEANVGNFQQ